MDTFNEIFNWILAGSLRASILVILVIIARRFLISRVSASIIYGLWLPVIIAVIVPAVPLLPALAFSEAEEMLAIQQAEPMIATKSPVRIPRDREVKTLDNPVVKTLPKESVPEALVTSEAAFTNDEVKISSIAKASSEIPEVSLNVARSWTFYLPIVWLVGAALSLFIIHFIFFVTRWQSYQKRLKKPEGIDQRVTRISVELGLKTAPKVEVSSAITSAAVYGFWRHTILLNQAFFTELSDQEQDFVIRHELTHIKRGDLKMNLLLCLLLSLHWFNPFVYLAFSLARIDREVACDSDVLKEQSSEQRSMYGHTLLKMQTNFCRSRHIMAFVGISSGKKGAHYRINSIISTKTNNKIMKIVSIMGIACLTFMGIVKSVSAAKPVQVKLDKKEESANKIRKNPESVFTRYSDKLVKTASDLYLDKTLLGLSNERNADFKKIYKSQKDKCIKFNSIESKILFYDEVAKGYGFKKLAMKVASPRFTKPKNSRVFTKAVVHRKKDLWRFIVIQYSISADDVIKQDIVPMNISDSKEVTLVDPKSGWVQRLMERESILDTYVDPIATAVWLKSLYVLGEGGVIFKANNTKDRRYQMPLSSKSKDVKISSWGKNREYIIIDQSGICTVEVNLENWFKASDQLVKPTPLNTSVLLATHFHRPGHSFIDDGKFENKYFARPPGTYRAVGEILYDHFSKITNKKPEQVITEDVLGYPGDHYMWQTGKTIIALEAYRGNDSDSVRIRTFPKDSDSGKSLVAKFKTAKQKKTPVKERMFEGWGEPIK